jgi:hypothetical protein
MNKSFSFVSIVLFVLNSSLVTAEDALVADPIVSVTKAVGFGVWKIYNTGENILFIDPDGERFLIVESTTNTQGLKYITADKLFVLRDDGTSLEIGFSGSERPSAEEGLAVQINGNLQDGRYGFGEKRFVVSGETITIFNLEDEDDSGLIVPATVLKKLSNELVHTGPGTSSSFEATTVLNADNAPGPALVQGDCLATYTAETGRVEIPCLNIIGNSAIFRVEQQQIPGTLTFEVDPSDISRVQ